MAPDGRFVASGVFSIPRDGSSNGAFYARVDVRGPNGNVDWTLYDDWLPTGLGTYTLQPVQWSSDSKVFYYTDRQSFDGCKPLASNGSDLWSVDIDSGKITQLLPMVASYIALSPDNSRLAYIEQGSQNLVFRNLKNGETEKTVSIDPGIPFDAGNLFWSPKGNLLVVTLANKPCPGYAIEKGPPADTTSILIVDTQTYKVLTVIGRDAERKVAMGWWDAHTLELTAPDGKVFHFDVSTELTSAYRTPVPTGIFPMVTFYEPLVLKYDPALWVDESNYNSTDLTIYGLKSTRVGTCRIDVQGPTDLNDPNAFTTMTVTLGTNHFTLLKFKELGANGLQHAWYMLEVPSIPGFDFTSGIPVLVMQASPAVWTQCKKLVEDVFATLSMSSGGSLDMTSAAPTLQTTTYEISGQIELEPLHFTVVQGGQIFTSRTTLYKDPRFPDRSFRDNGKYCIQAELNNVPLIACENYSQDGRESWVSVSQDGQEIYSIPTGNGYPTDPLQGLWVYGSHWALETIHITTHTENNVNSADLVGQVSVDGVLLNDKLGYEESFGFQTIAGYPFYFFKRDGKIGYAYNGLETTLDYDTILHYGCCSSGALNPNSTPSHVDFFAKKGDVNYFVIIGAPVK
jgi:hypothetical protein